MKTLAPSLTKSFAAANPIPVEPPVMTATFPSNLPMVDTLVEDFGRCVYVNTSHQCRGQSLLPVVASLCGEASIDQQTVAGHERRLAGRKPDDRVGNLH